MNCDALCCFFCISTQQCQNPLNHRNLDFRMFSGYSYPSSLFACNGLFACNSLFVDSQMPTEQMSKCQFIHKGFHAFPKLETLLPFSLSSITGRCFFYSMPLHLCVWLAVSYYGLEDPPDGQIDNQIYVQKNVYILTIHI